MSTRYRVGASRRDLTPPDPAGMHFFGWGLYQHVAKSIGERIHARAIAIVDDEAQTKIVMVCLDLGCVSEALRVEVMRRCGLEDHEVMLAATHTHSAPGGHSDYVLYALSCGGFDPELLEIYVQATVEAIHEALARVRPAHIRVGQGAFDPGEPVAFNRSIRAYNRNPSVTKRTRFERHLAVDRRMTLLRFDGVDGRPIALWNWFAVHGTCLHSDQDQVHPDNKGLAGQFVEKHFADQGHADFVAAFAQGAAGDVSPNFRRYFFKGNKRGASRDDALSCRIHSGYQARMARRLHEQAGETAPINGRVDSLLEYHDFSRIRVDEGPWGAGMETGPGEVGLPQIRGTTEGLGISIGLAWLLSLYIRGRRWLARLRGPVTPECARRDRAHLNKLTLISSQRHEVLGVRDLAKMPVPNFLDPVIGVLRRWNRNPHFHERPFSPQAIPLQLLRLGSIAVAAVPGEFTTVSGWHVAESLRQRWPDLTHAITQSYSNAYAGYIATPEEYDLQRYEGGCTHFGKWTLAAYVDRFLKMARRLERGERLPVTRPARPSAAFLEAIRVLPRRP